MKSIREQQISQRNQCCSPDTVKLSGPLAATRQATLSSSFKGRHRCNQMRGVPMAPAKVWSISCWRCRISRNPRISTYVICCQKEWIRLINSHHEPTLERLVKLLGLHSSINRQSWCFLFLANRCSGFGRGGDVFSFTTPSLCQEIPSLCGTVHRKQACWGTEHLV